MDKRITLLIAALFAAWVPASAFGQDIKIGIIGMMTGPGAAWGVAGSEGARFAIEDINATGGIDVNGTKRKVKLIVYDDQYKASEALSAYNRLVNEDGAKYLMTMSSASMMALKNSVENDKVLVLTSSYTTKAIDKDTKNIIRLYSTPSDYIPGIVRWMKAHIGGDRVAIVSPNDETGWDLSNISNTAFEKEGFKVISRELYERSQKDFLPLLTRVVAAQPDIIELGPSSPATAGLIVRQARELGYTKTFSALGGSGPREVVAVAGAKAAEGMVNMLYADPANAAFQALAERYRKTIGQMPNELIVPYYDATRVLLRAIAISGDPDDPAKVAKAFGKALPLKSLQGEELTFGGKERIGVDAQIMTPNYIGNIRNGDPVVVGVTK